MPDQSTVGQPGGLRMRYADAPRALHSWTDRTLGAPVSTVVDCTGGFSPGPAARVTCVSGRRAFDAVLSGADIDPEALRTRLPLLRDAPAGDVARVMCAVAMMWRHTSRSTIGLPSLRPWQRKWADSLTGWLRVLV